MVWTRHRAPQRYAATHGAAGESAHARANCRPSRRVQSANVGVKNT
ncbi:hypothetical protein BALAC2494_01659 [Bifidobacterium animalis subsp. lactis CNCM I-2494]|uniref:Uncharacterized protein n=1 Tax=Bifidobacterium animalis subsp. lactis CNCM I-2494 TaxID=1042403 RepID=A0A806FXM8_BIFAN|nr:hypothetical protein BALAC2494_01659 [Bifidobacterium animalis subsp. lactis CNCM I-2494]